MALSNPFEKLPVELTTTVLGLLESADIQSPINADPHMLRVFLQHECAILRPLRRSISRQFPGENLTQAAIACRLRQLESTPLSQDRAKYQDVVQPILTQSPEELPVTELKLGAIADLHRLFCEVEVFTSAYSKQAWEMTQDAAADYNSVPRTDSVRLPLSIPLSGREKEEIQMAYLLFNSYRHTLWFSTSFLQDYYYPKSHASLYYIPWQFAHANKLINVRTFDAVLGFLLREYNRLLCQVDDLLEGGSSDIIWQLQTREFLNSSSRDNFQFPAYLCSQGYRPLLDCQEIGNATEVVLSLYTQYRQLRQNRHTCPLVVVTHLKGSVEALFAGSQTERDFWTSGAFMFDHERRLQLYDRTFHLLEDGEEYELLGWI
ncbi:uncharacterized protein B0J16DRAFT_320820 [Fusarium flagelliforme]|uniref:uncharacterized protein n=1 Tax=Fusarium flagelliforme TaxID=2675880 RepID=UPI001E8E883B|nr:uncharacterized protein B0J16DRAFT_320820 [Fusarium flagelliforme]KAH7186062.1 hypothetical protein B0J16DRAFT_320820 [Fusarium flagelliforme]